MMIARVGGVSKENSRVRTSGDADARCDANLRECAMKLFLRGRAGENEPQALHDSAVPVVSLGGSEALTLAAES